MWRSSSARKSGAAGIGVLEHGVDQRPEGRAHRQVRHRGRHRGRHHVAGPALEPVQHQRGLVLLGHRLRLRQSVRSSGVGGARRGEGGVRRAAPGRCRPRGVKARTVSVGRGPRAAAWGRAGPASPARRPGRPRTARPGGSRASGPRRRLPARVGDRRHPRAAAEEHPVQRGVGRVALGGGVPGDDLRLGPRQGDVEQAQRLAGVLATSGDATAWRWNGARPADVAAAAALVVVEERDLRVAAGVAVPQGREVDDGVLQALAAVDGDQLHGRGVGVEAAGALGGDLELLVGDLLAQPGRAARPGPSRSLGADPQQRLADVAQVGEGALAADPAEHAGGQSLDGRRLQHGRDAARVNTSASVRTRLGERVGQARRRRRRATRRCSRRTR